MTYRQNFHRLTEANLSRHNESHGKSQTAAKGEKETMNCFREEDDPFRRFVLTGDSPHQPTDQKESKKGKNVNSLRDVVTYGFETERKDEA